MAEVGGLVEFADSDRLGDLPVLELMAVEHLLVAPIDAASTAVGLAMEWAIRPRSTKTDPL